MTTQPYDDGTVIFGENDTSGKDAINQALAAARTDGNAPDTRPTDERERFGSLSSLDKLMREAEKDITNLREIPIPGDYRPGWSFIVDCIISGEQMERYTEQSTRKHGGRAVNREDVNSTELNCRVLLNHVVEIREHGEAMTNDRGQKLNLRSPEFIEAMGKQKAIDALRKFVWDSHIGIMTDRVMDAAGYSREGDNWVEATPVNPTHG